MDALLDIPGITLTSSQLGGLEVRRDGRCLCWIHRRGAQVYAYLPHTGASGPPFGRYATDELAVRAVIAESESSAP